jgi:hypothetical protein
MPTFRRHIDVIQSSHPLLATMQKTTNRFGPGCGMQAMLALSSP